MVNLPIDYKEHGVYFSYRVCGQTWNSGAHGAELLSRGQISAFRDNSPVPGWQRPCLQTCDVQRVPVQWPAIHILAKAMWCIRFLMHTKVVLSNFGDTKNSSARLISSHTPLKYENFKSRRGHSRCILSGFGMMDSNVRLLCALRNRKSRTGIVNTDTARFVCEPD